MNEFNPVAGKGIDTVVLIWYAIAAITGGFGGCGAAAVIHLAGRRQMAFSFMAAYLIVGAIVGTLTYAFGTTFGLSMGTTGDLMKWCLVMGTSIPLLIFLQNWSAKIVLKKLGIEIQITLRRDGDDRRKNEDE